jgi:multiple sugar transport system substrate-binding protein
LAPALPPQHRLLLPAEPAAPAAPAAEEPAAPAAPAPKSLPLQHLLPVIKPEFAGLWALAPDLMKVPLLLSRLLWMNSTLLRIASNWCSRSSTNDVAYDTLATQIAAGNAPDIVGPVGIRGRDSFKGAWLDLQPFIEANNYDLSDFDPAMVEFYQVQEEGQLGIPFAIFPSFVIYNQDLFDEAGLPYLPTEYGQPYVDENGNELEWNMDTLRDLAMKLTVDSNGLDATEAGFDNQNIVQFGFMNQWTDPRGIGTFFGSGSLLADDGRPLRYPPSGKKPGAGPMMVGGQITSSPMALTVVLTSCRALVAHSPPATWLWCTCTCGM